MKVPPQMIELMLRSAGAPPALIETLKQLQAEGFDRLTYQPMPENDPIWERIGATTERTRAGIWLRTEGPNSRATVAIFLEGANNAILQTLDSLRADDIAALQGTPAI